MRAKNKNKARLINIFFVLNLNINLLLDKRMCYKNLRDYFDKNNI